MTATHVAPALRTSILSPPVTATFGFVVYALSMISGEVFEVNIDSRLGNPHLHTFWDAVTAHPAEMVIGLVGVAIAVWAGRRVWSGQPGRLTKTAIVLAAIAAVSYPVLFWAGWPNVFGAVAVGLALEHRRRLGALGWVAATALVLGSVAFVAGAVTCVLG
jgi:hypothetical protein